MGKDNKMEEFEVVEKGQIPIEEIVIYRDIDDMGRVFVTKPTLRRFRLTQPPYKLVLDTGEQLYEISPQEAIYIIEHAKNDYSPYLIRYQNFDFKNELVDKAQSNKKRPAKGINNVINIFRDIDDSGRAFVTVDVLRRFNLPMPKHKVLLGDMVVYEIDPVQAINIINNCNNKFAPYDIQYINIQFERTITKDVPEKIDRVMPYLEPEKVMPYLEKDKIMPYLVQEKVMPYLTPKSNKQTFMRKPRAKRPDETDEHYVAYLEGFYDCLFGYTELDEKESRVKPAKINKQAPTAVTKPRGRGHYEDDKEYVAYLKDYYHRMFRQEDLDKVSSKNLIQQRPKREDESDKEYQQYLSMFYEPEKEAVAGGIRRK